MKKFLALVLVLCMMLPVLAMAEGEVKIGQVQFAAHGTKCFAVLTVAMQGDKIVAAYIDEYQFMAAGSIGVPNSDADFGQSFPEGKVLASKKANDAAYSENMKKAGSTVTLGNNYALIEAFVVGKTVAELEGIVNGFADGQAAIDAVSGCTLVDTLGYLKGLLAAAKSI